MANMGSGGKGRGSGAPSIPPASKKMVESLREIVNCPEHEIYAMLKECNMDPNDTVNRLLSQAPFHEVKSKREKKKETKDTSEPRPRVNSYSSRGGRSSGDRNIGRSGTNQFVSSDSGGVHSRPAFKKENGDMVSNSVPSASITGGNIVNYKSFSDSLPTESTGQVHSTNCMPLTSQASSGCHSSWGRVPGQVSMADIVKRGRPQSKPPSVPFSNSEQQNVNFPPISNPLPSESYHEIHSSQQAAAKVPDVTHEPADAVDGPSVAELSGTPIHVDPSSAASFLDEPTFDPNSPVDENKTLEGNLSVENLGASLTSERIALPDDSHQSQELKFEEVDDVGIAVSSPSENLQKLSLREDERESLTSNTEDSPAVIIPNHLQVPPADCSHLSFGSFGSAMNPAFAGSFLSDAVKSSLEESSIAAEETPVEDPDVRTNGYYGHDQLRPSTNENEEAPSSSRSDIIKQESATEPAQRHHFSGTPSVSGYIFDNAAPANVAAYPYAQTNSQMQNLGPFSSVMQSYANALPSSLLPSTIQLGRESDIPYSPFLATQSTPTKYSSAISSISGPTMSMPEGVRPSIFSSSQPTPPPSTNVATSLAHPQHLPVHPYSPPTLPLGHFPNMFGYTYLPYLPYAAGGNSVFHQSPGALHSAGGIKYSVPPYKSSISVSSMPQSPAIASGYGAGFGTSTNNPGNFNLTPTPASTTGYEDVISSQYKENNQYVPIQQNEGSTMWLPGPGSRTMSALPASTFYSFQGQNQASGFRQGRQLPSPYGALGYPNIYHSQAGASQEHQQTQNDGTMSTTQGPPSQQSHQIWQHGY